MTLLDAFFSRAIRRGSLKVCYPDGHCRTFGEPDAALRAVSIRLVDKAAIRAIIRNPSVGAPEMYMAGRLVIEDDDVLGLLMVATANNRWERGRNALDAGAAAKLWASFRYAIGRFNMQRRSKRNVAHHYDLSDRLYDLFLDGDRQYSCAYYTAPDRSLEEAQSDKKAHLVAKMMLAPGMRVLDIGCGWGGLALYIHRTTGAEVLGVTLSKEQLRVARARAEEEGVADRVKFELVDYRELTGTFDRIVSVGMFEHVGTAHYRSFFRKCQDLLTLQGVMVLHTIGRAGGPGITDAFTSKYIFPGGYISALSEIVKANEDLTWYISDVEVLRLHYAYTIRQWYDRAVAARSKTVALYDERFYRMWTYYLAGSYVSFLNGSLVNYQVQFVRDRDALPITRDHMVDAERSLRSKVDG